jgi:pimeloyl-ACP methyl ester carboxylesterase
MVADTRAAIDAVAALPNADTGRVFLAGYDLGAQVALFTTALDDRVRGLALTSGIRALRLDAPAKGVEGIRHYSHQHGLLPRFGFFVDQPARLPLDDGDLLAMVAPRPVLAISPARDRYAPVEDVRKVTESARKVWTTAGKSDALRLETPMDFNRLTPAAVQRMVEWLAATARP